MLVNLINISYCAMQLLTYVDEFADYKGKSVQMLRDGQTEKELLDQGIDKHTIDLAMAIK